MPGPQQTTSTTTTPRSKTESGFVDSKALMAIRSLELRARVVVEGFWNGLHRSPYHGFSVEFTEYRPYSQGEDTRYLDWRLYARSDRFYIKKFEDETNLRCHLLVDQSRSMTYGSIGYSKFEYARTLAATLAWFLNEQGDAVGLFTFDEQVRDFLPARHRHGHLRQLMLALERKPEGKKTDLGEPLRRAAQLARKRGMAVLISDLLAPTDELEKHLARLAAAGHELVVFQVLDPNEVAFEFENPMLFHDVESGRDYYVDPATARAEYQTRFQAHNAKIEAVCMKIGCKFHRLLTNRPMDLALRDFLRDHNRRSRTIRRRTQSIAPA